MKNPIQLAFHLFTLTIRSNPQNCLSKIKLIQQLAETLDIPEKLAFQTMKHASKSLYCQQLALHSQKFSSVQVPDPKLTDFQNIFSKDFKYTASDNVKFKDEKTLEISGWSTLEAELFSNFVGAKEHAMARFVKVMKQKSDLSRKHAESLRASLVELSAKIYKKQKEEVKK
ncbi:hypothetical protein SS50377_23469 [Spironucleus salmonicida]|uniref:Uncharacterized protein n=1 Tax=Spironucleus salmonicida TaxID=348837 RepID=V6LNG6_9EUKA|nr:hypothetical protein SS50377_28842 [Spironucleus salmonicida]KAH0573535.1 hypothetical protein SS50377_23469 [Spironucleus salmonicida]|eukprot:EST46207.1 hypothetical protein SS50377_13802 [Spironucleus salmonicida]